jgi:DNA mismatch repair protein MutL
MGSIRRLPDNLVNQIAAGEVVERPSSVVKELLENALDAGAGSVEVALQAGGRRRVRVVDDGCGMTPEDARLALERHATSKIRNQEDLDAIATLGFRGEALPAIASVSRLSLLTSTGEGAGTRLEVEAGTVVREAPDARPRGTTVDVKDLFFNTPARAKFLRTVATELARSTEALHACALARPRIRFRLEHEGRELLQVAPASDTRDRVRQIFGGELAEGLIPVEAGRSPLSVSGYVSRPAFSRSSRAAQFVFVNGRQVNDRTLSHAIGRACRPHFPRERHPALFLFLEIPPEQVDVNVHPAKREVRFRTPGAIHDLLRRSLEGALSGGRAVQALPAREASSREAVSEAVEQYLADHPQSEEARPPRLPSDGAPLEAAAEPPVHREADLPQPGVALRILGQLRDTYVVVEDEEGLLLVDQHAAHERILYDRYRDELHRHKVPVQSLLFPVNVEVPPAQAIRFEKLMGRLAELGFAVEVFGNNAFLVREVPAIAAGSDPGRLLQDLVEQIAGGEAGEALSDLEHRVAALAACHAAVRAGMRLEPQRARHIVETLFAGGYALTCPHGRPATLRYAIGAIDRAFLRT